MAFTPVITTEGAAYLASVIASQGNVSIKEVKYSSTNYSGSEAALTAATFLGVFKTDASPSASVEDATTISISTTCDNVGITVATSLYSIGIIADDNGTDRLLCVCTTTTPDTVNPFALTASYLHYDINLAVSSTANITVSGSVAGALYVSDIVDNLATNNANKVLSAKQGKVLNDTKVNKVAGKGLSTNDYTDADKNKLAGIEANANKYVHPSHTAHSSGLYKVTVDGLGHVSAATAVQKSDITALGIPAQDTTYSDATTTTHGLMSATDKTKLNGIATGATKNTVSNSLSNTSTTDALSANMGHELNNNIEAIVNRYGSKNLIPYPYVDTTKTERGITYTDNEGGVIYATGSNNTDATSSFALFTNLILNKGKYKFNGIPDGGSPNSFYLFFDLIYDGTDHIIRPTEDFEFEVTIDNASVHAELVIVNGYSITGSLTFKPMIRDARITDGSFVPYAQTNHELTVNKADKSDITDIIATGSTNTTGSTITNGSLFYLNGQLCRAKVDIAINATFTLNTNFEVKSVNDELNGLDAHFKVEAIDSSAINATLLSEYNNLANGGCKDFIFNFDSGCPNYCMIGKTSVSDGFIYQINSLNVTYYRKQNGTWYRRYVVESI